MLSKNASFFKQSSQLTPGTNGGPQFGQSRIGGGKAFGSRSNISSGGSNTTNGGGLASRFSTALSKIIDFNGAVNENEKKGFNSLGNFGETDDDM